MKCKNPKKRFHVYSRQLFDNRTNFCPTLYGNVKMCHIPALVLFVGPRGQFDFMMRFLLRIAGTWLLGMSFILLVIDGTKSLAASDFVTTSLGNVWRMINSESLFWLQQESTQSSLRIVWQVIGVPMLTWPGWAVLGLPGIFLIFAGRNQNQR